MLILNGQQLDIRLVIVDKDGTLIAFDTMWHAWFRRTMELLEQAAPLDPAVRAGIEGALGVELASNTWDPAGPLTLASTSEVALLLAGQLYHHLGLSWAQAQALTMAAEQTARAVLQDDALLAPIGDVRGLLTRWRAQGLLLALCTTDERPSAERHLERLGLTDLFAATVCDGDGIALKPAPDMALALCQRLRVAPQQAIMVGDTVADLVMARSAGLAAAIGVTSGAMSRQDLEPYADWVVESIHALQLSTTQDENGSAGRKTF
jgi:phosphoglycolate phosphatase